MDPRLQAKLLRVLQEWEIDRVGGTKPIKVNIRLLATSNRDLKAEVAKGSFREDLLFRLNVVSLQLPPLRQRPGDIAALCKHFVMKYSEANGIPVKPVDEETQELLRKYAWSGNVRELENTMHRAVLLADDHGINPEAIMLPDGSRPGGTFDSGMSGGADGGSVTEGTIENLVGRTVADVERELIINTLKHCLGNRTHAANILGISIRTLRNKLKLYTEDGMRVPAPGEQAQNSATI